FDRRRPAPGATLAREPPKEDRPSRMSGGGPRGSKRVAGRLRNASGIRGEEPRSLATSVGVG
ncbi:MAG: hypothetical protein ACREFB_02040, partial [Stellaceae bacterium]